MMARHTFACLALALFPEALALTLGQPMGSQLYTTNAACSKNRCINPVFPAVEDLHGLSESQWQCSTLRKTAVEMSFCQGAINYDPALKASTSLGETLGDRVRKQDAAASEAFFYHLAGLGLESWDYTKPDLSGDECIKSVWRMVCYTHFPRASTGCQDGGVSLYTRPCQSSCMNYVKQCGVECCDEGVQCVFNHQKKIHGRFVATQGYAPYDGPSSLCTGAAGRSAKVGALVPLLILLHLLFQLIPATALKTNSQKANTNSHEKAKGVTIPSHAIANWRAEPDYLIKYEFVPPGGSIMDAKLNSCSIPSLSTMLQCSGRGVCTSWTDDASLTKHPARFCQCDRDWADPECRTRRKSQAVTFGLSLFLGMFGADQFYLGYHASGFVKLFTLGGGGLWWAIDVIRTGSAPVQTPTFRVAADLPHWAFALITITFAMFVGFTVAYFTTILFRARRRKDALLLQAEEEKHVYQVTVEESKPLKTKAKR